MIQLREQKGKCYSYYNIALKENYWWKCDIIVDLSQMQYNLNQGGPEGKLPQFFRKDL